MNNSSKCTIFLQIGLRSFVNLRAAFTRDPKSFLDLSAHIKAVGKHVGEIDPGRGRP